MNGNKIKLKCPHLADWMYRACEATTAPYAPSQFQLAEYCRSLLHVKCPFYLDAMDKTGLVAAGNKKSVMP
jgi:hypothetical protein